MNQNTYHLVVPGLKSRTVTGYRGLAMIRAFLCKPPYSPSIIYERPELGGSWEPYESQGEQEEVDAMAASVFEEDPPHFGVFSLEAFPCCVQAAEVWDIFAGRVELFSFLGLPLEELEKMNLVFEMSGNLPDTPGFRNHVKLTVKGGEPYILHFGWTELPRC